MNALAWEERESITKKKEKKVYAEMFSGFFKTSQVMIHFRNTDSLLLFHTGNSILLQGQENQREKERSESKMKAVRLDAQLQLCKMPALANSIGFKNVLFRIYYY